MNLACEFDVSVRCGNFQRTLDYVMLEDGSLQVSWTPAVKGVLQRAPTVLGPWKPISPAQSPFVIRPKLKMEFFRFLPAP